MADSDARFVDDNAGTPLTIGPRSRDRGAFIRESVVGISNEPGVQINPLTEETALAGLAKTIARGGTKGTTAAAADVTHTPSGANHELIDVGLYDASGNLIGVAGSPVRIDPAGTTTQPVSVATLPLPAGAATSAKQPSLGTAGTPSANVITVQGISGATPLPVDVSATSIQGATVGSTPPTGANNVMIAGTDPSGNAKRFTFDAGGALNSGFDGLQVSPASVTSQTTIFTQDMTDYGGIGVQVTSAGVGCTILYETSEDNITYYSTMGMISSPTPNGAPVSFSTGLTAMLFPKRLTFFRARVSVYGSATVTLIYSLHRNPPIIQYPYVQGPSASGAAISGFPVSIGLQARTTNLVVATGQSVYAPSTLAGVQIVYPWSIPELTWQFAGATGGIVNTTTAVTLKAAGAAGISIYLTVLFVSCDTLGAATELAIRDGAAGTIIWRQKLQTAAMGPMNFRFSPPLKGTAATLMEIVTLTAVTGGVYISANGFQGP